MNLPYAWARRGQDADELACVKSGYERLNTQQPPGDDMMTMRKRLLSTILLTALAVLAMAFSA
ncbi:MAG: hypothetical protein Q8S17_14665, partial [Humidesulfovibrio sp.]|nr:hypothetical protein [Humidesulfovibrio sp.]